MLSSNLTQLLSILNCTNAEIGKLAGCDPSLISKIKCGKRTPEFESSSIQLLLDGIIRFADTHKLSLILAEAFKLNNPDSEHLKKTIHMWLFCGDPIVDGTSCNLTNQIKKKLYRSSNSNLLGEKLDAVMIIAGVSNSRLARKLHVDSSYISRLRNGKRSATSNPNLSKAMSDYLFSCIWNNSIKWKALSKTIHCSDSDCTIDEARSLLERWMVDYDDRAQGSSIEELLSSIEQFSFHSDPSQAESGITIQVPEEKPLQVYWGMEGMRKAVVRFLLEAIDKNAPEIWLYSDEDMAWLINDETFFQNWKTLMYGCARNGTRIRIIHNIDRKVNEMFQAITAWLPLYMLGVMEPWYCTKSPDPRFSHTLFIIPETACISGFQTRGNEKRGWHDYLTCKKQIESSVSDFKALLKYSLPFVTTSESISQRFQDKIPNNESSDRYSFSNSLSAETMPSDLLKKILADNKIEPDMQKTIILRHEEGMVHLSSHLLNFSFKEFVPIHDSTESFLIDLAPLGLNQKLKCSEEDRKQHLKAISQLLQKNENYSFIPVSITEFRNIRIELNDDEAMICRTDSIPISFTFRNPKMLMAFQSFFHIISQR